MTNLPKARTENLLEQNLEKETLIRRPAFDAQRLLPGIL
jgi:hypothetical protein